MSGEDERFMRRVLELAARAPFTSPNPRVGAVVARGGEVLSEGWHRGAGAAHAEVEALNAVDARGATLYVNLEPCTHLGHTPPCAPALVEAGIRRVVAAIEDPDLRVRGAGLAHLRAHGVEVSVGVLEDEARRLNRAYLHQRSTGRPLVTLKLALTLDGRLTASDGSSRWITGQEARRHVHQRRQEVDAVMVGAGTVVADDPLLTVRAVPASRQPLRVIVDATGRVPPTARLFSTPEVVVATTELADHDSQIAWKEAGAEVLLLPHDEGRVDLDALLGRLGERGVLEVYCEGGGQLATSLLREGLAHRVECHYGAVAAGRGGVAIGDIGVRTLAEASRFSLLEVSRFGDDVVVTWERD